MLPDFFTRRAFAGRLAALLPSVGIAPAMPPREDTQSDTAGIKKLDYEGKPASEKLLVTPLVKHNGVIYIAGQGAHAHDNGEALPLDIGNHTKKVMENVKILVEAGGGTMDSVLQLTVYLAKIEDFDGMNKVFKAYFPGGGPARTTVAVANLPGNSLVEINCIAAVAKNQG